jgi:hypothetical protein
MHCDFVGNYGPITEGIMVYLQYEVHTMHTKTRATIDDLYKVDGKAELVHGEIVCMPPSGDGPSTASVEIVVSIRDYASCLG